MQKITKASVTLTELNKVLAVQRIKVGDQTKSCEQLLASISESTDVALEKKNLSEEKRKEIEDKKRMIVKEETEARQVLAEAQPALDAAKFALGELDKADITEIRFTILGYYFFYLYRFNYYKIYLFKFLRRIYQTTLTF